jgi:hypothetical protein
MAGVTALAGCLRMAGNIYSLAADWFFLDGCLARGPHASLLLSVRILTQLHSAAASNRYMFQPSSHKKLDKSCLTFSLLIPRAITNLCNNFREAKLH